LVTVWLGVWVKLGCGGLLGRTLRGGKRGIHSGRGEDDARGRVDPSARVIDARLGANGSQDAIARDLGRVGTRDDVIKRGTDVLAAKLDQSGGAGMAVNRAVVLDSVFLGEPADAAPVDEFLLDGFAFGVVADRAFAFVAGKRLSGAGSVAFAFRATYPLFCLDYRQPPKRKRACAHPHRQRGKSQARLRACVEDRRAKTRLAARPVAGTENAHLIVI